MKSILPVHAELAHHMEQWKTIRTVGINQIKLLASTGAAFKTFFSKKCSCCNLWLSHFVCFSFHYYCQPRVSGGASVWCRWRGSVHPGCIHFEVKFGMVWLRTACPSVISMSVNYPSITIIRSGFDRWTWNNGWVEVAEEDVAATMQNGAKEEDPKAVTPITQRFQLFRNSSDNSQSCLKLFWLDDQVIFLTHCYCVSSSWYWLTSKLMA